MVIPEPCNILDEKVFDKLFALFFDKVVRFITSIVKSEDIALDLAQDVFAKLWEKRESIEINPDFGAYLYVLAKNCALRHLSRQKLKEMLCQEMDSSDYTFTTSIEELYHAKETWTLVKNCVKAMPEPRREIFILSRTKGMSNKDIAGKLGISVRTVEWHLYNALSELRKQCFSKKKWK